MRRNGIFIMRVIKGKGGGILDVVLLRMCFKLKGLSRLVVFFGGGMVLVRMVVVFLGERVVIVSYKLIR